MSARAAWAAICFLGALVTTSLALSQPVLGSARNEVKMLRNVSVSVVNKMETDVPAYFAGSHNIGVKIAILNPTIDQNAISLRFVFRVQRVPLCGHRSPCADVRPTHNGLDVSSVRSKFRNRFSDGNNPIVRIHTQVASGRSSCIFPRELIRHCRDFLTIVMDSHWPRFKIVKGHPSPLGANRSYRCLSGPAVEKDRVNESNSTYSGQHELESSQPNNFLSRVSHALLRDKIFYFTLFGFLLLPFGALGLFWIFEYPDRETRRRGRLLACLALPTAFSLIFYGLFV